MGCFRKGAYCLPALLLAAAPATAQRLSYEDLTAAETLPRLDDPAEAAAQAVQAADETSAPAAQTAPAANEGGDERTGILQYGLLDRLEWIPLDGADAYSWDLSAFIGGKTNRIWLSAVGDGTIGGPLDYLELQALYSHAFGAWDVQIGPRFDARPHPQRVYATLGVQGDATEELWFAAYAYLSNKGELSGRINGQYNLTLVDRLVLQPSFELDAYATDIEELGIGRGFAYGEAGLRLRYEIVKSAFAPYVGFSWERSLGRTARMARSAGEDVGTGNLVLGVRSEF
jgi:copper resistance protein B